MNYFELNRAKKIILNNIDYLKLDLSGLTILTEVGSGLFNYTPIIAQFANAKKVYAYAKDNNYGTANDAINDCLEKINYYNLDNEIIEFTSNTLPINFIRDSHIITNSGNLRPLDSNKLKYASKNVVIPLMYEAWELRESDIDVNYCLENNIPIAGTWENYPGLEIFNYCKNLIVKIVLEAGFEIKSNKIIIWSEDHFGQLASEVFNQLGAKEVMLINNEKDLYENVKGTDFIFFCDYKSKKTLFGEMNSCLDIVKIKKLNADISVIHLAGDIDNEYLKKNEIYIYPDKRGYPIRMTYTLTHLGIKPTLMLLVSGLKVGECLIKDQRSELVQLIS